MPEMRQDPVTGCWVIIASERSKRPHDFRAGIDEERSGPCPFCYGNEAKTPPEVLGWRAKGGQPNTGGWSVRAFANKFPAVLRDVEPWNNVGFYTGMNATGYHEVIVDSPKHNATLGSMPLAQAEKAVGAIHERFTAISSDPSLSYIQVFKNSGASAGASIKHTHWQVIALPLVPGLLWAELAGAGEYFAVNGKCVFCAMVAEEIKAGCRLVEETGEFIVFCPYAARFPFEMWVLPKKHGHNFGHISPAAQKELAGVLKRAACRLETAIQHPPYNIVLHTAPLQPGYEQHYHWHLEILPRLAITAGFEWGAGAFINPTSPEIAAAELAAVVSVSSRPL